MTTEQYTNAFIKLWNLAREVIDFTSSLWEFLTKPIAQYVLMALPVPNTPIIRDLVIFFNDMFVNSVLKDITLLDVFVGGGILVLMGAFLIKTFVPVA